MNTTIEPTAYRAVRIADIPLGEGRQVRVASREIAIFRSRSGAVYATQAACPHRGGPLADGLLGGSTLICPLHAWRFDLETGEPVLGTCALETYPAAVDVDGYVVVRL